MDSSPVYSQLGETLKSLQKGLQWITTAGYFIPNNAIPGGVDEGGQTLYIARTICDNGLYPGKAGRHMPAGCSIIYDGAVESLYCYQVLCGDPSKVCWVPHSMSALVDYKASLLFVGFEGHRPLCICKSDDDPKGQLGQRALNPSGPMLYSIKKEIRLTSNFEQLEYND